MLLALFEPRLSALFPLLQVLVPAGIHFTGTVLQLSFKLSLADARALLRLGFFFRQAGFNARKPKGSFFLYVPAPKAAVKKDGARIEFKDAGEISQWLITEKLISTVPWDDACAYLRFSVTFAATDPVDEKRVLTEIARRLGEVKFEFQEEGR